MFNPYPQGFGVWSDRLYFEIGFCQDRHLEVVSYLTYGRWTIYKGPEASYGNLWNDATIIAYGYWPNCNHTDDTINTNPIPYCGCIKARVVSEPY
jgi:hypothetical protein